VQWQIREQVYFTKGRIIVRGKLVTRGKAKFADYSWSNGRSTGSPEPKILPYLTVAFPILHFDEN
jgi:hypothetical protein